MLEIPPVHAAGIIRLGEPAATELVGGKAAHLSRLAGRYRVPPGFCITTRALERWTGEHAPADLLESIHAGLHAVAAELHEPNPWLAVRSSAVDEDGHDASFAGLYATILGVRGERAVIDAILECRRSASQARVHAYHAALGATPGASPIAVIVQALVPADAALVAFSANPVSGDRLETVINACWGLGESVVSGETTPDTFTVRDGAVTSRRVGAKARMTVIDAAGTRTVPVPTALRDRPAITDVEALEVDRLARTLEAENGWPVDIECAISRGALYLLQCRPITTLTAP